LKGGGIGRAAGRLSTWFPVREQDRQSTLVRGFEPVSFNAAVQ
jgi:hypothetical protein